MNFVFRKALLLPLILSFGLSSCAQVSVPDARNVKIPSPVTAEERREAVNERPDSVMYLPLGADVLVPERIAGETLPDDVVGPFELRSETLAGALQLILADYDVSIAFETEEGLNRKVTVANLKGKLNSVVNRVCGLADLYCSYEDDALIIKDRQTFTVTLPPLAGADGGGQFINDVITGLNAVLGEGASSVSDPTTRSIIYTATQRTSKLAENYFQRLRANTAMIVFETYIWEVSLDSGNSTGIDWSQIDAFGKFNTSINFNGSIAADFTNPVSIGLPTTQALGASPSKLVEFLSRFGAVKTISQPQITVLSGSEAELRVADTENYVSEVTSTISGDNTTTSVSTDSVDSGFTLSIDSSWDKSTVYANVNINLTNVDEIEDFTFSDSGDDGTDTIIQLPQTSERELTTQIRVRPGDSVLIGGLVREVDNFSSRGPGFMEPILPDSRTASTANLELVILLRPRVIVYTEQEDARYQNFVEEKKARIVSPKISESLLKKQERRKIEKPSVLPEPQPVEEEPKKATETSTEIESKPIAEDNLDSNKPVALPTVQGENLESAQPEAEEVKQEQDYNSDVAPNARAPYISRVPVYEPTAPRTTSRAPQPTRFSNQANSAPQNIPTRNLNSVVDEARMPAPVYEPTMPTQISPSSDRPAVQVMEEFSNPPSQNTTMPWIQPTN